MALRVTRGCDGHRAIRGPRSKMTGPKKRAHASVGGVPLEQCRYPWHSNGKQEQESEEARARKTRPVEGRRLGVQLRLGRVVVVRRRLCGSRRPRLWWLPGRQGLHRRTRGRGLRCARRRDPRRWSWSLAEQLDEGQEQQRPLDHVVERLRRLNCLGGSTATTWVPCRQRQLMLLTATALTTVWLTDD